MHIPGWVVSSNKTFSASILRVGRWMTRPRRVVKPTCILSELKSNEKGHDLRHKQTLSCQDKDREEDPKRLLVLKVNLKGTAQMFCPSHLRPFDTTQQSGSAKSRSSGADRKECHEIGTGRMSRLTQSLSFCERIWSLYHSSFIHVVASRILLNK